MKLPFRLENFEEIMLYASAEAADRKIFFERVGKEWVGFTGAEHIQFAVNLARHFYLNGLVLGDQVLIMASNSYAWLLCEHACLLSGLEVIAIEPNASKEFISKVLRQVSVKALIYDKEKDLELIQSLIPHPIKAVISAQQARDATISKDLQSDFCLQKIGKDTPATVIFTSGTTGTPKALRYTHGQLILAFENILNTFDGISSSDRTLCWLPMASLFQRIFNLCAFIPGVPTYFVSPQELALGLLETRPTLMITVPRFFEKIYADLHKKLWWVPSFLQRRISTSLGFFVRKKLGGKIRFFISGSAKCSREHLEYFQLIGMPILEAYGMSESVVPISMNTLDHSKQGSVGRPLNCNKIKISSSGELLVYTPTLAKTYLGDAHGILDSDGFLPTGDRGYLDEEGFLFLDGRLNDVVKTSTGRKINLNRIERAFAKISGPEQIVALAENLPAVVLVVTGIPEDHHHLKASIQREVDQINTRLASHEQVREVFYWPFSLSVEDGTLTRSLKVRRRAVQELWQKFRVAS